MYPDGDLLEIAHRLLYHPERLPDGHTARGIPGWLENLRSREIASGEIPTLRQLKSQTGLCRKMGIRVTFRGDPSYPVALNDLDQPPPVLFYRGALPPPAASLVSIVGSRRASRGGLEMARNLGRAVSALGLSVLSGMARGIDQAAHRGGLESGESWAVMGCGLDRIYPPEAVKIALALQDRGGLLSEFPPGSPPLPFHFPRRNRLIAVMSRALVVVEAGERSGALTTAREALAMGHTIGVVPGNPMNPVTGGSNRLLFDGAEMILGPEELTAMLRGDGGISREVVTWDPARCSSENISDIAALAARTGWLLTETLETVARWEGAGLLTRVDGNRFLIHDVVAGDEKG
jgi:DNA protecting protein DprA